MKKKKVWLFCKDPGGTKGVFELVKEMEQRRQEFELHLFTTGAALKFLPGLSVERYADNGEQLVAELLARSERPDLVVTTLDSLGGAGVHITRGLQVEGFGGQIVALSDYPVSGALKGEWNMTRPDWITSGDEIDAAVIVGAWPEFDPGRIKITGYPAFDRLARYDAMGTRRRVRGALGISTDCFLVTVLTDIDGAARMMAECVEAFGRLKPGALLCVRSHPRMERDVPEEYKRFKEAQTTISDRLVDTSAFTTEEVMAASSCVIAMYSTALGEAAAMRLPAINFALPWACQWYLEATGSIAPIFPWVAEGVVAEAHDIDELYILMEAAHVGILGHDLRPYQEKRLHLDGGSARRVADFLSQL